MGRRALIAAVGVALAFPGGSAVAQTSGSSRLLRLSFSVAAKGVDSLYTSGPYVLLSLHGGRRYVLLNDQRKRGITLRGAADCTVRGFAVPWILFGACATGATNAADLLYDLRSGRWRWLRCDVCGDGVSWDYGYVMGSDWLWFDMPYGCPGEQYGNPCSTPVFVRIPSGRKSSWQPDPAAGTVADLDSTALRHQTCLRLPLGLIGPFDTPMAPLVSSLVWRDDLTIESQNESGGSYTLFLQGCGSRPDIPLLSAQFGLYSWMLTGNARTLVWWVAGRRVDVILIPGLRHFQVSLPVVPKNSLGSFTGALQLTSTRIYLLDDHARVWSARLAYRPR